MPTRDNPSTRSKTAFEVGQWDRLSGRSLRTDSFFLVSEQVDYDRGWRYEQMELDEVLPYITPFTPPKKRGEGREGHGSR